MDDPSRFCCRNCECPEHGKRGVGNLTVTSRYLLYLEYIESAYYQLNAVHFT